MILFIDASAIVAMLAKEPDALDLADRLDDAAELIWSPIVKWEAAAALSRIRKIDPYEARSDVHEFGRQWSIRTVAIDDFEGQIAVEAYALYGKRAKHKAKLNLGDCFTYACAKTNQADLLYKGNDFAQTDLA